MHVSNIPRSVTRLALRIFRQLIRVMVIALVVLLALVIFAFPTSAKARDYGPDHRPGDDDFWKSIPPQEDDLHGNASEDDRIIQENEIGMGGPLAAIVLLRDGAIFNSVASEIRDLDQGRLRIALKYENGGKALLVYDRDQRCLYTLDRVHNGMTAEAWFTRMATNPAEAAKAVRAAFQHAESVVMLHNVLGLMVEEAIAAPPMHLERRLRNDSLLEAHSLLPPDLRGAADPLRMLNLAPYRITMDGQETGLHGHGLDTLIESPGGACLIVGGRILNRIYGPECWHIWHRNRWYAVLAEATFVGKERNSNYDRIPTAVSDDGVVEFRLQAGSAIYDLAPRSNDPPPRTVELRVSWQSGDLELHADHNIIALCLPTSTE